MFVNLRRPRIFAHSRSPPAAADRCSSRYRRPHRGSDSSTRCRRSRRPFPRCENPRCRPRAGARRRAGRQSRRRR
ncbi:hypothetical protein NK6_7971 [Bradyrhizobium diazoefficiens]|uniref:Uncharacterized protein n=1 Tax=Bradyrhizobium diazoefficiens TaxID=1355477 RepID=A0A0E4FWW0_9BRAD|nr:hypothetical protein NK6_7971 [Bradyrhizobium diazoefficiens]